MVVSVGCCLVSPDVHILSHFYGPLSDLLGIKLLAGFFSPAALRKSTGSSNSVFDRRSSIGVICSSVAS